MKRLFQTQITMTVFLLSSLLIKQAYVFAIFNKPKRKKRFRDSTDSAWVERLRAAMGIEEGEGNEYIYAYDDALKTEEQNKNGGNHTNYYLFKAVTRQFVERFYTKVFVTKPPRGAVNGFISATINVFRGYYNGVAVAMYYPWEGYQRNGLVGLFQDTLVGAASGILVTASGAAASFYQLKTGLTNTVASFWDRNKWWDRYKNKWTNIVSLDQEKLEMELLFSRQTQSPLTQEQKQQGEQTSESIRGRATTTHSNGDLKEPQLRKRSQNRVKDPSYYNILKVPADASPSEIKQAYYREARKVHPDKKKDDAKAAAKFHQLKSVYDALMDEEMREIYDTSGALCFEQQKQVPPNAPDLDPYVFFAVMFGSYLVEPYIGQLAIASIVDNLMSKENAHKLMEEGNKKHPGTLQQRERWIDIALNLRNRVGSYASGTQSVGEFRASCKVEAQSIASGDFGDIFLTVIGSVLVSESEQFLGDYTSLLGAKGTVLRLQNQYSDFLVGVSYAYDLSTTIGKSVRGYLSAQKENEKIAENDKECKNDALKSQVDMDVFMQKISTKSLLNLVWKYNTRDITSTLRQACKLLLLDDEPLQVRLLWAEAMLILGQEFFSLGRSNVDEASKRYEEAEYIERFEAALLASSFIDDEKLETAAYF